MGSLVFSTNFPFLYIASRFPKGLSFESALLKYDDGHDRYFYLSKLVTLPGASGAFLRLIIDQVSMLLSFNFAS